MKLIEVVKAYNAVEKLMLQEWDFDFARAICKLYRLLEHDYNVYNEAEMELVNTYGKKNKDGFVEFEENGVFSFATEEDMVNYLQKSKELQNTEAGTYYKIVVTNKPKTIRPDWLDAISPFFIFKDEE